MRPPTANAVEESNIPGGLDMFIENENGNPVILFKTEDGAYINAANLDTDDAVLLPDNQTITVEIPVAWRGNTRFIGDNPDNCERNLPGDGTKFKANLFGGNDSEVACLSDDPGTTRHTFEGTFFTPGRGETDDLKLWIEGAGSGTRVTPLYGLTVGVVDEVVGSAGDSSVPGDFNAEIVGPDVTMTSETFGSGLATSLTDFPGVPDVEPNEQITLTVNIKNAGSTFPGAGPLAADPNHCTAQEDGTDVSGTSFRFVVDNTGGTATDTVCIRDNPPIGSPRTETANVVFRVPDEKGVVDQMGLWVELRDGTRITPKYPITISTVEEGRGDFAGDNIINGGVSEKVEDEVVEETDTDAPDPSTYTFDLNRIDVTASLSRSTLPETESFDVDIDLSYFVPLDAPQGSYEIPTELLVDGEVIATDPAFATVNGSTGSVYTLSLDPGTYDIAWRYKGEAANQIGEVEILPVFDSSDVTVSCGVSDGEITEGEAFDVTIEASNDNQLPAAVTYDVLLNDSAIGTRTLNVEKTATASQTVEVTDLPAGDYDLSIDTRVSEG